MTCLHLRTVCLIVIPLALTAVETIGPFTIIPRLLDPEHPSSATLGRDGSREQARLLRNDAGSGTIEVATWSGDAQSGASKCQGGLTLQTTPGQSWSVGLEPGWELVNRSPVEEDWLSSPAYKQDAALILGYSAGGPPARAPVAAMPWKPPYPRLV